MEGLKDKISIALRNRRNPSSYFIDEATEMQRPNDLVTWQKEAVPDVTLASLPSRNMSQKQTH
jgi:hypothetical protein